MKTAYFLFTSGLGIEMVWGTIEQSQFGRRLIDEPAALLADSRDVVALLRDEQHLATRVWSLAAEVRRLIINEPYSFGVLVHHDISRTSDADWEAAHFGEYGGLAMLDAMYELITSPNPYGELQDLVGHLRDKMTNGKYGYYQ